jgi:hypothetical protein
MPRSNPNWLKSEKGIVPPVASLVGGTIHVETEWLDHQRRLGRDDGCL